MSEHHPNSWSGKRSVQAEPSAAEEPAATPEQQTIEPEAPTEPAVTDAAKSLAEEHGIDLATVSGTGADGRITKEDVAALVGGD